MMHQSEVLIDYHETLSLENFIWCAGIPYRKTIWGYYVGIKKETFVYSEATKSRSPFHNAGKMLQQEYINPTTINRLTLTYSDPP